MDESTVINLKKLRVERRLTQEQVADAIGITKRTIIRWEAGHGEPGVSELRALASLYGVSIDQLVGELLESGGTGALPKVADLSGDQLNYWVARTRGIPAEMTDLGPVVYEPGFGQRPVPQYCTDFSHAGPIIREKRIHLSTIAAGECFDGRVLLTSGWIARCAACAMAAFGETELEAAMRAYLSLESGRHVMA
jgi:transcriptional regulator with XRE-family HTH domain